MKAMVGKRKAASVIVVALILVSLFVPAALAAPAPPPLNLPPGLTTVSSYGDWLAQGQSAAFSITFSNIVGSFDVANGVAYPGWCLEDAHLENSNSVTLLSSYATNLPTNLATYTDPLIPAVALGQVSLGDPVPWDKLNYLLNHKPAAADGTVARNTQAAVKLLMWGANTDPIISPTSLAVVQAAVADANANGSGFVPAPGQIIAVILYAEGFTSDNADFQEAVIELTVPPYYDRGDLPATYPTLNVASGPSHLVGPGLFLGQCVDTEPDGQPNAAAFGDDPAVAAPSYGTCTSTDDEDGVVRTPNVNWQTVASVDVTVGAGSGCLSGLDRLGQ